MKYFMVMVIACLAMGMSRKPKEDVKELNTLKTECENLHLDLESLGAKKWTKVIDNKVKQCKDHGFWPKKKRAPIKSFTDDL